MIRVVSRHRVAVLVGTVCECMAVLVCQVLVGASVGVAVLIGAV